VTPVHGRALRVLQVVLSLHPGGTERLVIELVKRLHADVPMAVCCLDEEGAWAGELARAGVRVEALHRRAGFQPLLGRAIARMAAEHRADVIHCHHYSPFVYGALSRVWRRRSRVVFTEHGRLSDARPSARRRRVNALFARLPARVYAVSGDLRQHLVEEGFPAADVQVIYNGIDPGPVPDAAMREARRRALGADAHTFVIGTIARLDPVKDLGTLIHAVELLGKTAPSSPSWLLAVIGDGPERRSLERQVQERGLSTSVRLLGARNDAREWLAACDVYVNSSISEGVSLTILEAMAARLPVVVTRVGGTPEVVADTCGILVPAREPGTLAGALGLLAGDGNLRCRLGAAGRQRVEETFSLDRMVRQYRSVYESVAASA
jgi:L-malate glycosyltransferase